MGTQNLLLKNNLSIWRPVLLVSTLGGRCRSAAAVAHDLIHVEADGKCQTSVASGQRIFVLYSLNTEADGKTAGDQVEHHILSRSFKGSLSGVIDQ